MQRFIVFLRWVALLPVAVGAAWAAWFVVKLLNRIGMAAWLASCGHELVFAAFDKFSQKSKKYDATRTHERWYRKYPSSPPTSIGAGTLFMLADGTLRVPCAVPSLDTVMFCRSPDLAPEVLFFPAPANSGPAVSNCCGSHFDTA